MRVRLKHVHKVRRVLASGEVRTHYYHRLTKNRIEADPANPAAFSAAYMEAAKGKRINAGTLASLIDAFMASAAFSGLKVKTRRDYERYLALMSAEFGAMEVEALNDREVRGEFFAWRDGMAASPRSADYAIQVARRVLSWAYDRGRIGVNHLANPGRLYESDRSEIIWEPQHIAAFCHVAPKALQEALLFALYTGQRQADVLRMGPQNYREGWLHIRQSKTKREVQIPVLPELQAIIDRAPGRLVYLVTPRGTAWKADHFRKQWRAATKAANLTGLHFHDLRGTAVTRLRAAGLNIPQVCAITGHEERDAEAILRKYTANSKVAVAALESLAAPERNRAKSVNGAVNGAGGKPPENH